jgi:hypothetical protein
MAASSITTPIQIGPRLRAELVRRVRELECRFKPAPRDMRELAQLKEFLNVTRSETAGVSAHSAASDPAERFREDRHG